MLALPINAKLYFYTGACDMRRVYNGLSGLVRRVLGRDPADDSITASSINDATESSSFVSKAMNMLFTIKCSLKGPWNYLSQIKSEGTLSLLPKH